jgi:hypothetical protein
MSEIIPARFICREHDRELTSAVVTRVAADPVTTARAGLHKGELRGQRPFKVIVRCDGGDGHDLVFSGTYRP